MAVLLSDGKTGKTNQGTGVWISPSQLNEVTREMDTIVHDPSLTARTATDHRSSAHNAPSRASQLRASDCLNNGPGVVAVETSAPTQHVLPSGRFLFGDAYLPITVDLIKDNSTIITIDLAATAPPGTLSN